MEESPKDGAGGVDRLVASEHRRLESLFRRTRAMLASPWRKPAAAEALERLCAALDGHLAHEDRLYYPPIWVLRPELKDALEALVAAHEDFRRRLGELTAEFRRGEAALAAFDAFTADFGRHEVAEEGLLARIDAGLHLPPDSVPHERER